MKIGIIGLRPRQIADVRARSFNGLEVEFYDEKTFTQEKIASFSRKMDKIILLPQHVPKRLNDWILKSKLQTVAGGSSVIIRLLSSLQKADKSPPARDEPASEAITAAPITVVKQSEPTKLMTMVPAGFESQYTWRPSVEPGLVNKNGSYDYALLDAAVPGDSLRFKRPSKTDLPVWKTRVAAMRSYRSRHKDQLIEAHFYPEYVDVLIMDPSGVPVVKPVVAVEPESEAVAETPVAEETAQVSEENAAVDEGLKEQLYATPEEMTFWDNVYLTSMAQNATPDEACEDADKALAHRRLRF